MLNKLLCISTLLLFALFVMAAKLYRPDVEPICQTVNITIVGDADKQLITEREVAALLHGAKLNPDGKRSTTINTEKIEQQIQKSNYIARAECYRTAHGNIQISVHQRQPFFRVFSNDGNFYVGKDRTIIPISPHYAVHMPLVSGNVGKEFACDRLYNFIDYLSNSSFWDAMIDQIHIDGSGDVILIPKVGDQEIILGRLVNYERKMENLMAFYREGIGKVGWGKYATINLKFENQVVCTKR